MLIAPCVLAVFLVGFLGGEVKQLTVLFTDIPGFTALSESMSPAALADLLNEYFTGMTEIIFKHWGTLDKYMGDTIKGMMTPLRVYELVGTLAEAAQHRDRLERFARGLAAYRERNWAAALENFEALNRDYPQDGPSHAFAKRCGDFLHHPPQANWDGVYDLSRK